MADQINFTDEGRAYGHERVMLVQTDQPAVLQVEGRPTVYRQISVTKCLKCLALVLEEDVAGHARYHAEIEHANYWGRSWT